MGSRSVTCHPTQVNALRITHSQTGRYSTYQPWRDGRLSLPIDDWLHSEIRSLHVCWQSVTHPSKRRRISVQAIYGIPSHNYGVSLAVWDHTVLPATRHKRTHPASTPARQAGSRFTDHLRMEGWVSPGPGWKEQLAHCCYATARASETRTHDLANASRAR